MMSTISPVRFSGASKSTQATRQTPSQALLRFAGDETETRPVSPQRPKSSFLRSKVTAIIAALGLGSGVGAGVTNYMTMRQVDALKEQVANLEELPRTVNAAEAAVNNLEQQIAHLQELPRTVNAAEAAINTLEQQIANLQELPRTVNAAGAAINTLEQQVAEMQSSDMNPIVAEKAIPTNVQIDGNSDLGSGTFFRDDKGDLYILTNHHVVHNNSIQTESPSDAPRFNIRLYSGNSNTPVTIQAEVVRLKNQSLAMSEDIDLAVLKVIEKDGQRFQPPAALTPKDFRNLKREPLKNTSEKAWVIGSPLGLSDTITGGHISHPDRRKEEKPFRYLQTDASVHPGNSGGGLFDNHGRYLGTIRSVARIPGTNDSAFAENLGTAIRVDSVLEWLNRIGIQVTPG